MTNRLSTEDLLQELNRLNEITDGTPTQKEMNEIGHYSVYPYKDRFGSWNESLREAGISPNKTSVSKDELIEELKKLNKNSSGSPTQKQMNEVGKYSAQTYHRRFGSWNTALEQAGLSKNKTQYTEEELLRELRRLDDEFDHSPTQSDMDNRGQYYTTYYQREFGSWNKAKVAAGIDTIEPGGEYSKVSRHELIDELNRLDEETNGSPTKQDMQRLGEYSHQIYRRKFGSWNHALEEAGLTKNRNVEEETLLGALLRLDEDLDRSPSQTDVNQYTNFSHRTYANKFGSFNIAKEKAELDTRIPGFAGSGENHPSWKGGYEPYYGPSWHSQRRKVLERDGNECAICGMTQSEHKEKYGSGLEVHHIQPFREFGRERHEEANQLDNLITLCKSHHLQLENLSAEPESPE